MSRWSKHLLGIDPDVDPGADPDDYDEDEEDDEEDDEDEDDDDDGGEKWYVERPAATRCTRIPARA